MNPPAPGYVLDTIARLASPCTLDPREVASIGDGWAFTYYRALRRGESVAHAEALAWTMTKADLVAYFDGCQVVPALGVDQ